MTSSQLAENFVACINAHDVGGILKLCTADHVFIDSLGNSMPVAMMRSGWQQYFRMVPDYRINIDEIIADEDVVVLIGSAGGTYVAKGGALSAVNKWQTPAAFRARVRDEQISEWRVYCDNEPIREKMRAATAAH